MYISFWHILLVIGQYISQFFSRNIYTLVAAFYIFSIIDKTQIEQHVHRYEQQTFCANAILIQICKIIHRNEQK